MQRVTRFALLVAAPALLTGCQQKNTFVPPPPAQVTVARPVEQEVVEYLEFTGTTAATAEVDIRARVNGYLREITFKDGAEVQKGDLLFVIEPAPFEADFQAAQAAHQKAEASLQLAQANLARVRKLAPKGAVAQEDVDLREADLATATAEVAARRAEVRQAELTLSHTEVRSPISGRVGRHMVDIGALVQSEQTLLTTVESIDPIYAYYHVSEPDLLRLHNTPAQDSASDRAQTQLQLAVGSHSEFQYQGIEDYQDLGVDPQTGTTMRRGLFSNPNSALLPGLFVRIRTAVSDPVPRLLVEERALAADQRGDYVLVVNQEDVVEYRPVKLGTALEGKRVVEGIDPTDWIVVNGLQRARPGAKVNPQRETQVAGGAAAETAIASSSETKSHSSSTSDK